jgi:prepilin-type N-terminal cleavage/methylation domain-containing protein
MINKKNKGFTLIELIVTVTIIAVLTVVGIVSYSGINRRARDSRRMADLEKVRIALELYRQGTGSTYPSGSSLQPLIDKGYLQQIPINPKGDPYNYSSLDGYTYTYQTKVEEDGSSNVPGGIYQVTNP